MSFNLNPNVFIFWLGTNTNCLIRVFITTYENIHSLPVRTINTWNSLPNKIVDAESVNTFKTRLDKYWKDQPLLYDFKAELAGTGDRSKCDIEV